MMKISEMPKYEVYKDSGVEWIGAIPVHWNSFPLCAKSKLKSISNNENEELLSVYLDKGVIKFDDVDAKRTNTTSSDLTKYQLVDPGDFVLNNQQAWRGSVGVSDYRGIVSPAYLVLSLSEDIVPRFGNYLFRDGAMVANYLVSSKGVGTIQRNLYWPQLKRALVFLPPTEEQLLIACFLDKKTALIDEAISIKEKQINLLKERKQIIIQQAVTQGLDPNVPMKDSGVDWIGKIPAHWGCTAVKRLLDIPITDGPHTTPQLHDEGIPFISAEAIKGGEINFDKKRGYINEKDYLLFSNKYTPKVNDIYMVKSGATTGRVAIVRTEMKFTIWSPLAVFRVDKNKLNPLYLYYFLQSYSFLKGVELSWSFGTQQNIGMGVLGNLFALAPPLEEQQLIVNSIEPHFREIDIASEQVYQQIEKLKEYKTTLINSAVTGKIKITPEMVEQ
ncbi:restriction endonuclease subunit S [Providencia sp. PROV149]|uniref:restriction endonuclease subunit S n=1 Tax=Providencia sp. PROV149 TaxID=2949859 RepID=UPI00234B2986|nr:restriction endonuclease subunit S [Providencia sp. PROV149]